MLPTPSLPEGSPDPPGWGLGLGPVGGRPSAGARLPHSSAAPPPSLHQRGGRNTWALSLGSLTATTAAPLAFLRVLIGQGAQPPGPLFPEMSWARERNLIVCHA